MSAFNSIPTVKFFVIHVSCVICNICWHSMHVRTVQQEHQDHQLAQHVIHKYVIFFFFLDKPRICNLSLLFHVFLCLYKEDQCNRLIRTAKTREREREREAWMHSILLNPTTTRQSLQLESYFTYQSYLLILVSHFHIISFIIFLLEVAAVWHTHIYYNTINDYCSFFLF